MKEVIRYVRSMQIAFMLSAFSFLVSVPAEAQTVSSGDRDKMELARQAADGFQREFCETLDFGTVWNELRSEKADPSMAPFDVRNLWSKLPKSTDRSVIEKGYITVMNYGYLNGTYLLNVKNIEDQQADKDQIPEEIRRAESSSKFLKENSDLKPQNINEFEEFIAEVDGLAKLYRKYMPSRPCESSIYRNNLRFITQMFTGYLEDEIINEGKTSPRDPVVKEFRVRRGTIVYFFIEEKGEMKLLKLGNVIPSVD
jgi:hypothetical protein